MESAAELSRVPRRVFAVGDVPFASSAFDECGFCFDVSAADAEYPVYYNHQDEPRARFQRDGSWEDPANATPDFPHFGAWLAWVADELTTGREPATGTPSDFYSMPGRKQ